MQAATTDQFRFLDGLAAQQKQNPLLKVLFSKVSYGVSFVLVCFCKVLQNNLYFKIGSLTVKSLGK